ANKNDAIYYPLGGASFAASDAKQYLETKLTEKVHTYTAKIYCPVNISRTGVILGNYQNNNGEQPCLNFEIHSNGTPSLYIKDSNGVAKPKFNGSDADGNRLSDVRRNGWVHLVIVDTGSEFRCYIDGVFTEAVSYSAANVKAGYTYDIAKVQSVNQLSVGRDTRDNLVFTGKIDHIAYYSEVLTDSEIAKLYKNGVDTDEESLMFYYDLSDGNNSPVIEDKSDNKNNASPLYYARPTHKTDFAYSIAVVGDTQKQVWRDFLTANDSDPNNDTHYTDAIYQWLVDNKDSKNIQYVFGVGDITENNGNPSKNSNDLEWEIAKNAITKLDAAGMAYSVILGNHDTAAQFNKFFADPTDDFYTSRIDGYYVEGDLSNYYVKFEINGIKYLHIGLEYGPRDAVLEWAGQVADDNPERIVIVTTHAYMFRDGTTLDKGDVVPPNSSGVITSASSRNNGDMMWEKFASQHRNILLVLSGHDPYENIAFRQDKGIYGNTVSQFLVDPQGMSVDLGMVCMLYFDEDGRQVDVEWISTAKTQAAQKNNPDATDILYKSFNQFDFELYSYAGNGIHSTELVSRDGNIDTYRIYYTNGTYTEYTVENGLAITVTDVKKETDGLIDTYTIYFSDGSSTSYTVKNGEDGKDGADGKTPYIGENGNWWIGITDTGVSASGGAATEPDYGNEITSGTCGSTLNWFVTDKNILVISGKGSMTNYRAGETPWINYAGDITEVVVKEGVTTIGKNAFNGLTKLNSVKLPVSLLSIEGYAFYGCAALDSVNIPVNVRFIGAFAFRKSGLSSLGLRAPEAWSIKGITETPDKMDLAGVVAAYIKNEYYTYDWYVADVSVGEV
ncbi:MAG: leucine-rich repeat protein, partial [Clostridia bacterium]|nr:leucine-rich repeat protein [Clostridia bacterium]